MVFMCLNIQAHYNGGANGKFIILDVSILKLIRVFY